MGFPSFLVISAADKRSHLVLTTSNILFRPSPYVTEWSDAEVYSRLSNPERENVITRDGNPPGPHAPAMLVAPIQNHRQSHASLQETTIISDFGQSNVVTCPQPSYEPGTVLNYQSPETRFEGRTGFEADIWTLGRAIFEIRAGFSLFESFMGSDVDIFKQTVEMLGRLPDVWWVLSNSVHFGSGGMDGQRASRIKNALVCS